MDSSPPGSSVHGDSPGKNIGVLEWVAISFFRESFQLRNRTQVSRIVGRFFIVWATGEGHNAQDVVIYSVLADAWKFLLLFEDIFKPWIPKLIWLLVIVSYIFCFWIVQGYKNHGWTIISIMLRAVILN